MAANFDAASAETPPNKTTGDVNDRKNKENTSNEEQISEKKNKNMKNHGLTVLLHTIKNESKQKIQNRPVWPTITGQT